ncbi:MAG: hypothetical protein PHN63_02045 [Candidatus Omnitrophica bacterium]|nr:hypothetical protein [Candidatus Omnitrophota bacterium]
MSLKAAAISLCIFVCAASTAFCEDDGDWLKIETNYFTIEYQSSVNLQLVAGRLNKRGYFSLGLFGSNESSEATPEEQVARRVDSLLKRAEELLDMYPSNLRITIKIFKDESSVGEAYFKIFGTRPDYKAFFIYQYKTIYTSEFGISDSVIIHEMAHAVVDSYFSVNPPSKASEVLAIYVDMHLEE